MTDNCASSKERGRCASRLETSALRKCPNQKKRDGSRRVRESVKASFCFHSYAMLVVRFCKFDRDMDVGRKEQQAGSPDLSMHRQSSHLKQISLAEPESLDQQN